MSKIIKAVPDEAERVEPFGFEELGQDQKASGGTVNVFKGELIPASTPEPIKPFGFQELQGNSRKTSRRDVNQLVADADEASAQNSPEEPPPSLQDLMLNAERKAQELEEEAYRKGYEQGEKDGHALGLRSMTIVKEHLESLLGELQQTPETILRRYRDWLVETCLAISRHIVRRELAIDHTQLSQLIDMLLREAAGDQLLTLAVHPDDLHLLEEHLDLKELAERTSRTFSLKADASMERGGCRLESELQVIDASLEKRFQLVEQVLRNEGPSAEHIST